MRTRRTRRSQVAMPGRERGVKTTANTRAVDATPPNRENAAQTTRKENPETIEVGQRFLWKKGKKWLHGIVAHVDRAKKLFCFIFPGQGKEFIQFERLRLWRLYVHARYGVRQLSNGSGSQPCEEFALVEWYNNYNGPGHVLFIPQTDSDDIYAELTDKASITSWNPLEPGSLLTELPDKGSVELLRELARGDDRRQQLLVKGVQVGEMLRILEPCSTHQNPAWRRGTVVDVADEHGRQRVRLKYHDTNTEESFNLRDVIVLRQSDSLPRFFDYDVAVRLHGVHNYGVYTEWTGRNDKPSADFKAVHPTSNIEGEDIHSARSCGFASTLADQAQIPWKILTGV